MQTPGTMKIDLSRVVVCDGPPLEMLEEVMELNWIHAKTQQEKRELMSQTLPSLASGAVKNKDFLSLEVLLEQVDVNSGDYDGNTPLHTACQLGNVDMVRFLLEKGASARSVNCSGQCPLHLAIKNRHFTVIKLLRLRGFTVNLHPVRIAMEMIQAVQKKDYPLLHAWSLSGVDMNLKDYNGRTVMDEAVRLQDKAMISKLLEYGARHCPLYPCK